MTYDLSVATFGEVVGKWKLTLMAPKGGKFANAAEAMAAVSDPSITLDLMPLEGELFTSTDGAAPIKLKGTMFVSALGPVLTTLMQNAESGQNWSLQFSTVDAGGKIIGGAMSTSSPAFGGDFSFLGALED